MKAIRTIGGCLLAALLAAGCTEDEDLVGDQTSSIVSYLTSTLGLVSEQEAATSPEGENIPYYSVRRGAYRYIPNMYRAGRPTEQLSEGETAVINFEAYTFGSQPASVPYFTNIPETGQMLSEEYGLNTEYWDFTPKAVPLSEGSIIKGLLYALPECRVGDTVQVFMPSTLAYDDRSMGVVEADQAVMFTVIVTDIEK